LSVLVRGGSGGEAFEVVELHGKSDGGDRLEAAEASQGRDGLGVARIDSETLDVDDEVLEALFDLLDGEDVVGEDHGVGGVVEAQRQEPASVGEGPGPLARREGDGTAEEELAEAMTGADEIFAQVLAGSREVASRLVLLGERLDLGEEARPEQQRELCGRLDGRS